MNMGRWYDSQRVKGLYPLSSDVVEILMESLDMEEAYTIDLGVHKILPPSLVLRCLTDTELWTIKIRVLGT